MRIVSITDLHGRPEALRAILADVNKPDIVLLGGDITNFGSPSEAERLVGLARQMAPTVLAVAGNCDSPAIDQRLFDLEVGLHGRGECFETVGIHGVSAIPPWKRGMYQLTEEELGAAIEQGHAMIREATHRILLAHVPPKGTKVDRTFFWIHAGSAAVRSFIDREEPSVVFCGHIHEGRGLERLGKTTVCNCGLGARGEYAVAEVLDNAIDVSLRAVRV